MSIGFGDVFNKVSNGANDYFNAWRNAQGQGNAVYASNGLFGFPGSVGSKIQVRNDAHDFAGMGRATQGQPLFGNQVRSLYITPAVVPRDPSGNPIISS